MESAKSYVIESAILTANRTGAFETDIAKAIIELNIYENIELPYLTGYVLVNDDIDLLNIINFSGTERLEITISLPGNSKSLVKKFVVEKIENVSKVNDYKQIITLKLIEEHAFNSRLVRFSKAYTGKPEKIIEKVLKDQLQIELLNLTRLSSQLDMKVVIPYMTPLQSCEWMRARTTTSNGSPYFLFSALNESKLVLKDLDTLFAETPWNRNMNKPFVYSQQNANKFVNASDIDKQSFIIQSFFHNNTENSLALAEQGTFGAQYGFTDLASGVTEQQHFSVKDLIDKLRRAGLLLNRDMAIDPDYAFNGKAMPAYNSAYVHQLVHSNTYPDYPNYYQNSGGDINSYMLNAVNVALRSILFKNTVQLHLPGLNFITGTNRSVGNMIDVHFFNSNLQLQTKSNIALEDLKDKKKSGEYLVYATKHIFTLGKHNVVVDAVKITVDRGIDGGRTVRGV
jgi:hypothetical protein